MHDDDVLEQVLEKKKENDLGRISAVRSILEEAYGLFALFYGSIKSLLAKNPNGDMARSCLRAFFPDYLSGMTTLVSDSCNSSL
jgi:hypothetical protein